jgi:glutathione S-transferase
MPESAQEKALVRRCIASADATFVPSFYRLLKAQTDEDQAKAGDRMLDALCQIDEELNRCTGPYLFGKEVTLADMAIYPWFERWPAIEHYRGLQIPEALERLHQWIAAMQRRESVQKNVDEAVFYIAEYAKYANGNK